MINFNLLPTGEITDIALQQDSHEAQLDQLAIAAVKAIRLVNEASKFINKPENFSVKVVFE